ncbi:MAG: DUF4189 domain-containing protein [Variovorax sp.]|nr:DUF4189 domain-containing protein [Variovorax sp.]
MSVTSAFKLLPLLSALLYASASSAEGPCPAGQRMVGQQNVPGASYPICQSIPGANSAPQKPRAIWADRWGAIFADTTTGDIGTVVGRTSRSEAINEAMNDCRASGAKHCELKLAYKNQCAAGAWGSGNGGLWVWTGDPKKEGAETRAVASCSETTRGTCQLFYSACSYVERVQ